MMAQGPSNGCIPVTRHIKSSRRESCFSLGIRRAVVYDVEHSLTTRMSCRWRLITSAANEIPTASGELSVDWRANRVGKLFHKAIVGHDLLICEIASFKFSAKK